MNVSIGFPWWLRPLLLKDVVAITIGKRVFLSPLLPETEYERILRHERVHVEQMARLGITRFFIRYLREYVANRRAGLHPDEAYRRISFEQEALIIETSGRPEDS